MYFLQIMDLFFLNQEKTCAIYSTIGRIRKKNEDKVNFFIKNNIVIYIICDGMGGHLYGEFAAEFVIKKFEKEFLKFNFLKFQKKENYFSWLIKTVNLIKKKMYKIAKKDSSKLDMGTTLAVCLFINNNLYIINIGDCRVYLYSNSKLIQVTVDQNLLNNKKYKSLLKNTNYTMQKLLLSALGPNKQTLIDTYFVKDFKGMILMSSDGFHDFIDSNSILSILKN